MHERYDYLTARVEKKALPDLRAFLVGPAAGELHDAGGLLWGSWLGAGSIGWDDDQAIVIVAWPDEAGDARGWLAGVQGVATVELERLRATARPEVPAGLTPGGVRAHRRFELEDAAGFDELLALSTEAWPAFEHAYDASIEGFFRATDDPRRVLLVTRYASVAEWERSRGIGQADSGELADARERFMRRRQLTRRQVVRIAPLVAAPPT